jgi:hypothetical protein
MATAFQITSIIFIFSYSATPVQNKIKQVVTHKVEVRVPYKAQQQLPPNTGAQTVTTSANKAAAPNFYWKTVQPEMMIGNRAVIQTEKPGTAIAGFSNFIETVFR